MKKQKIINVLNSYWEPFRKVSSIVFIAVIGILFIRLLFLILTGERI